MDVSAGGGGGGNERTESNGGEQIEADSGLLEVALLVWLWKKLNWNLIEFYFSDGGDIFGTVLLLFFP